MWTIPNILTLIRLFLIPVFIISFYYFSGGWQVVTASIFLLAAITDWFDGYLARRLQQSSPFGAFLDPVVDKLMVVTALLLLVSAYPSWWMTVPAVIIVTREITVSALREWMAQVGKHATVKVSYIGKVKTAAQMTSLVILLWQASLYSWIALLGFIALYLAVGLTIASMVIYLYAARVCF